MKWPAIVFRLTSYCVVIDVALELFLHYQYSQYTSDVYFLVQRWQKVSQITGFGIAAILLFWSGLPLLRKRASWKNAPRATAGISIGISSLLWFYFFGGSFPRVMS